MFLKSVEITNYKCFRERSSLALDSTTTVVVGRNNVGKTALLEALGLRFDHQPNRGPIAMPRRGDRPHGDSLVRVEVPVSGSDVETVLRRHEGTVLVPVPEGQRGKESHGNRLLKELTAPKSQWHLRVTRCAQTKPTFEAWSGFAGIEPTKTGGDQHIWHNYRAGNDLEMPVWRAQVHGPPESPDDLQHLLWTAFLEGVFGFRAERMNVGRCTFGNNTKLTPDAANLPEVLNVLQANPTKFRRYNEAVRRVFPHVRWVSVQPPQSGGSYVEVLVWSIDPETERDDLAIPLLESGTGVSQVLAMLYVVLTADTPQTVLIDEPNSFLHPAGVSALLEIFREHDQHQYVLATHSPAVIAGAMPKKLYVLENDANEARIKELNPKDVEQQRLVLDSVGARLSDVFGPDQVLWVEGRTEERCFPLIAEKLLGGLPTGTAIVSVVNTGDFRRRFVKTTTEVYRRLSEGVGLIPPACGFVFDRETLDDEQQQKLKQACGEKLEFLPRRMYENYLLVPEAIAAVLNETDTFKDDPVEAEGVAEWIEAHRSDFGGAGDDWHTEVDGAGLLDRLFAELSEAKESYDKVFHGVQITEWILGHTPEALQEVAALLAALLPVRAGRAIESARSSPG